MVVTACANHSSAVHPMPPQPTSCHLTSLHRIRIGDCRCHQRSIRECEHASCWTTSIPFVHVARKPGLKCSVTHEEPNR